MNNFNYKKATQIINFFSRKEGTQIDKLKLIKLIWLSDRLHLRKFGRFITDDSYFAMKLGPVPSSVLDLIDANTFIFEESELEYRNSFINLRGKLNVCSIAEVDEKVFSKTDLKVMEEVYSTYSQFTGDFLSDISHEFPEWRRHKKEIESGIRRKAVDLNDFFENIVEDIHFPKMNLDEEHLKLSKEFFFDSYSIA